ncbi:Protein CBG01046 [Caenorhabditis briggsae]|uniref:Protein CBG01046 n=1 Tax=Caenorhabditis briggsae TaxID=6238 RepID=A8WP10_CAEBR|nr:Protein CBG01046 [Caenorhabditis briggsae]CAP22216.1 Protein CBG01046 [Caenorhabditis briggsae]
MKTPEEVQTEMMSQLFRSKSGEYKKLNESVEYHDNAKKNKHEDVSASFPCTFPDYLLLFQPSTLTNQDPSELLASLEKALSEKSDNLEFEQSLHSLITLVIGMFTSSPHWLVRDKALKCLRLMNQKLGNQSIDKHAKALISCRKQRKVLKNLLTPVKPPCFTLCPDEI